MAEVAEAGVGTARSTAAVSGAMSSRSWSSASSRCSGGVARKSIRSAFGRSPHQSGLRTTVTRPPSVSYRERVYGPALGWPRPVSARLKAPGVAVSAAG